jgi:hypothetical protein
LRLERDHPGAPAAATLNHFYTLFREREEQSAMIGELRDTLKFAEQALLGIREAFIDMDINVPRSMEVEIGRIRSALRKTGPSDPDGEGDAGV